MSEQEMVIKFCQTLEKAWQAFAVEVPLFHRSIDVVYLDQNGKYYAIEFKLKNWKQAINQARDYMMGANFTFICIPKHIFNEKIENAVLEHWFGIIIFDEEKWEFQEARKPKEEHWFNGRFLLQRGFEYACENKNYQYLLSLS